MIRSAATVPVPSSHAMVSPSSGAVPVERLFFLGVTIEILVSGEETAQQCSLLTYSAPAGFRGPAPHRHREITETFHLLSGRLRFVVDGEQRDIGPGGVVVVPPGRVHCFANPFAEPARVLIHCSPGGIEGYFREVAGIVAAAPTWPPVDLASLDALGQRYDIFAP
jgi:mannose-6-phosphate isomerase-like protein (cupin superfamily)